MHTHTRTRAHTRTFCADAVARMEGGDSAGQVCARRLRMTWARFEVRAASLQAEHISQHRFYDSHRVAVLAWLRPDAPVELRLQASLSDDRLLAGSVPQPEDWIRAWRAARTPKSWQAAAESCESEHYIRHCRDRSVGARALEQQARVMREAMRQDKREALRRATCISLSFDDRKGYKLVLYRADALGEVPPAAPQGDAVSSRKAVASEGLIGCFQCLRGSTLEDLADDYGERAGREVLSVLSLFLHPSRGVQGHGLVRPHPRQRARHRGGRGIAEGSPALAKRLHAKRDLDPARPSALRQNRMQRAIGSHWPFRAAAREPLHRAACIAERHPVQRWAANPAGGLPEDSATPSGATGGWSQAHHAALWVCGAQVRVLDGSSPEIRVLLACRCASLGRHRRRLEAASLRAPPSRGCDAGNDRA